MMQHRPATPCPNAPKVTQRFRMVMERSPIMSVMMLVLFWAPFVLPGMSEDVPKVADFSRFLC